MSIESWKAEAGLPFSGGFVPAPTNAEWRKITLHSLNKWKALRPGVLARHGLRKQGSKLLTEGAEEIRIGNSNCALCVICKPVAYPECWRCPLHKALGRACDKAGAVGSPWYAWVVHNDPEPMITALTKTLKELEDVNT